MQRPGIKTIGAVVLLILSIIVIYSIKGCNSGSSKELVFEKVRKGMVRKTISVTGDLEIMDPYTVLSKINGIVEKIYIDYNQDVKKGQLLMKFDPVDIDYRVMKSQTLYENVQLEKESQERELEGKRNLFKDNLISKNAMELAEINYKSFLNKYKQVKLDYQNTLREKQFTSVYAPISGIVVSVHAKKNFPAGVNAPLALLAPSLKKMILNINVDESDIGYVKKNQSVVFSVSAYPDKRFNGNIDKVSINPEKSGGLVTYKATVICDNSELLLKPGMTATATVIVEEKKDVLMILSQSLIAIPDGETSPKQGPDLTKKTVWKKSGSLKDKGYKRVEIKVGLQGDMHTEVVEGLKENEEVYVRQKGKK